jgi:hypothetical protein
MWSTPTANMSLTASMEALIKEANRPRNGGRSTLGTQVALLYYEELGKKEVKTTPKARKTKCL